MPGGSLPCCLVPVNSRPLNATVATTDRGFRLAPMIAFGDLQYKDPRAARECHRITCRVSRRADAETTESQFGRLTSEPWQYGGLPGMRLVRIGTAAQRRP
jgi:hypothetical protein